MSSQIVFGNNELTEASGGGDGPEAVTAGMAASLTDLEWRRDAAKMVVLITDAPPHGQYSVFVWYEADGQVLVNGAIVGLTIAQSVASSFLEIKGGDPNGHDPLVIARAMAQNGITLVSS